MGNNKDRPAEGQHPRWEVYEEDVRGGVKRRVVRRSRGGRKGRINERRYHGHHVCHIPAETEGRNLRGGNLRGARRLSAGLCVMRESLAHHAEFLLGVRLHAHEARLDLLVARERGVEHDADLLRRAAFRLVRQVHALHSRDSVIQLYAAASPRDPATLMKTYLGIDRSHLCTDNVFADLAPVSHVGDERVGVVRHVHAQEARFLCDGVSHSSAAQELVRRDG